MRAPQPDQATVTRIVRAAVGRDAARRVRATEGGEHHVWWVDGDLVARFAPDPAATARLRREVALRDLVRPHLAVPVPVSVATGSWAPGLGFTLDRRLPGTSADAAAIPPPALAELAGLLTGLAGVSTEAARRIEVPVQPPRDLHRLRQGGIAAARRLLDRVSGVLDWTDAELGDPATDVAGLAIAIGADAAEVVATTAGLDRPTRHRGIQLARWDATLRLAQRRSGQDTGPVPLLRHQLQRALQPTEPGAGHGLRHGRRRAGSPRP
jgi:aminoglycoside phosphotransferase (APT) family kinase protein